MDIIEAVALIQDLLLIMMLSSRRQQSDGKAVFEKLPDEFLGLIASMLAFEDRQAAGASRLQVLHRTLLALSKIALSVYCAGWHFSAAAQRQGPSTRLSDSSTQQGAAKCFGQR